MVNPFFMIFNLTQHVKTADQEDVVEPNAKDKEIIKHLLTFTEIPKREWMIERADMLAKLVAKNGYKAAMIGGAPFFMPILEAVLKKNGIQPYYAFSKRVVIEQMVDDKIVKKTIFKHLGFYKA